MMEPRGSGSLVLYKKLGEGATIGKLLEELAAAYPNFRTAVFNPDMGTVADQVVVVLNDALVQRDDPTEIELKDGDRVMLLPQFAGGQGHHGFVGRNAQPLL